MRRHLRALQLDRGAVHLAALARLGVGTLGAQRTRAALQDLGCVLAPLPVGRAACVAAGPATHAIWHF